MRIGLTGSGTTVDRIVDQAVEAEEKGFSSLWYASAVQGDPMVAIALAGRATSRIELGTSVLQTYTCHPVLQANRAASVAAAMGRPGLVLGVGPSHAPVVEGMFGMSYDTPGRHTEEYLRVLCPLVRGEGVNYDGTEFRVNIPVVAAPAQPVSVMVSALAPRLLRVGGELTEGTILWMANARAIETHVAPRITAAATNAGRDAPRVVAGLPVAVTDDVDGARTEATRLFANYGVLPNYRRILDLGDADGPADAAIVGDESAVARQIEGLFRAGATDVWAAVFPVGDDRSGSRRRTRALLEELANA